MQRIAIIGNAGGGKSTLARMLSTSLNIPVYEIDQFQQKPGWVLAPPEEFARIHDQWLAAPVWIIDGWGPWNTITDRCELADTIILVDYPLAQHYWWAGKRQIPCLFGSKSTWPPPGCRAIPHTFKLFRLIGHVHHTSRPQMLDLAERYREKSKRVVHLRSNRARYRFIQTFLPNQKASLTEIIPALTMPALVTALCQLV